MVDSARSGPQTNPQGKARGDDPHCRLSGAPPFGPALWPAPDQPDRVGDMAKGQMRSNKEAKKPKKEKPKPAVTVASTSASRIQGSQDKNRSK